MTPLFAAMIVASCGEEGATGPRIATLIAISGGGQQGAIGATLTQPLVVRLEDQAGSPVEGVTVQWRVVSGGGSISPSQSTTDADGRASASLRLGTTIGVNTATASIDNSSAITFSAAAVAAPPAKIIVQGGEGQTATVSTQLASDLLVKVTDAVDNAKAGVAVTFTISSGGGTLTTTTATSDANGLASTKWTLGNLSGTQTVLVAASGVTPVSVAATARAAAPQSVAVVSGSNQTAVPGTTLPDSLRVRVLDRFGNPVSGATVTFTPRANGGTVSPTTAVTDANGRAATRWTLAAVGGPMFVDAASGGFSTTFLAGGIVTYTSISAGGRNTCAVASVKVLFCWGYNGEGQLGIGQASQGSGPVFAFPQPSASAGNLTFREVVSSLYHACGVTLASVGYCWGVNHDGRLGDGTLIAKTAPTQIGVGQDPGAHSYRVLGVSQNHTCGITLGDRIFCWGYTRDGQIGNGPPVGAPDATILPVEVSGNLRFSQMSAGGLHTCAITNSSATYCWGVNLRGELGNNSTVDQNVPTLVGGGNTFSSVSAGFTHTCAIGGTGVFCWGDNQFGQLGAGTPSLVPVVLPAQIGGFGAAAAVSAGQKHTCAILSDGTAYCWGLNDKGQLGDGTTTNRSAPTLVAGGLLFAAISAGDGHSCGVTTTNIAYCWGDNQFGQLGDGSQTNRLIPMRVAFQP
ncbi:MAG: hypothetical protein HOP28_14635 [Gemmatimonadales bacterium]|nr:hypothetical protein [Gemmatimonadales bacterium]